MEQTLPWKNTVIGLTGFSTDVKNYIEKDEATQIFLNNSKYRFRGFELTGETMPVGRLSLRASYSYLYSKDASPGTEKQELQYRPRNKYAFEAVYNFTFGLTAYASVSHTEKEYFYSKKSPFIKRRLNDYALLNLRVCAESAAGQGDALLRS